MSDEKLGLFTKLTKPFKTHLRLLSSSTKELSAADNSVVESAYAAGQRAALRRHKEKGTKDERGGAVAGEKKGPFEKSAGAATEKHPNASSEHDDVILQAYAAGKRAFHHFRLSEGHGHGHGTVLAESSVGKLVTSPPRVNRQPLEKNPGGDFSNDKKPTDLVRDAEMAAAGGAAGAGAAKVIHSGNKDQADTVAGSNQNTSTTGNTRANATNMHENTNPSYGNAAVPVSGTGLFFDPKDTQGGAYGQNPDHDYSEATQARVERERNLKTVPSAYQKQDQADAVKEEAFAAGQEQGRRDAEKSSQGTLKKESSLPEPSIKTDETLVDPASVHGENKLAYNRSGISTATQELRGQHGAGAAAAGAAAAGVGAAGAAYAGHKKSETKPQTTAYDKNTTKNDPSVGNTSRNIDSVYSKSTGSSARSGDATSAAATASAKKPAGYSAYETPSSKNEVSAAAFASDPHSATSKDHNARNATTGAGSLPHTSASKAVGAEKHDPSATGATTYTAAGMPPSDAQFDYDREITELDRKIAATQKEIDSLHKPADNASTTALYQEPISDSSSKPKGNAGLYGAAAGGLAAAAGAIGLGAKDQKSKSSTVDSAYTEGVKHGAYDAGNASKDTAGPAYAAGVNSGAYDSGFAAKKNTVNLNRDDGVAGTGASTLDPAADPKRSGGVYASAHAFASNTLGFNSEDTFEDYAVVNKDGDVLKKEGHSGDAGIAGAGAAAAGAGYGASYGTTSHGATASPSTGTSGTTGTVPSATAHSATAPAGTTASTVSDHSAHKDATARHVAGAPASANQTSASSDTHYLEDAKKAAIATGAVAVAAGALGYNKLTGNTVLDKNAQATAGSESNASGAAHSANEETVPGTKAPVGSSATTTGTSGPSSASTDTSGRTPAGALAPITGSGNRAPADLTSSGSSGSSGYLDSAKVAVASVGAAAAGAFGYEAYNATTSDPTYHKLVVDEAHEAGRERGLLINEFYEAGKNKATMEHYTSTKTADTSAVSAPKLSLVDDEKSSNNTLLGGALGAAAAAVGYGGYRASEGAETSRNTDFSAVNKDRDGLEPSAANTTSGGLLGSLGWGSSGTNEHGNLVAAVDDGDVSKEPKHKATKHVGAEDDAEDEDDGVQEIHGMKGIKHGDRSTDEDLKKDVSEKDSKSDGAEKELDKSASVSTSSSATSRGGILGALGWGASKGTTSDKDNLVDAADEGDVNKEPKHRATNVVGEENDDDDEGDGVQEVAGLKGTKQTSTHEGSRKDTVPDHDLAKEEKERPPVPKEASGSNKGMLAAAGAVAGAAIGSTVGAVKGLTASNEHNSLVKEVEGYDDVAKASPHKTSNKPLEEEGDEEKDDGVQKVPGLVPSAMKGDDSKNKASTTSAPRDLEAEVNDWNKKHGIKDDRSLIEIAEGASPEIKNLEHHHGTALQEEEDVSGDTGDNVQAVPMNAYRGQNEFLKTGGKEGSLGTAATSSTGNASTDATVGADKKKSPIEEEYSTRDAGLSAAVAGAGAGAGAAVAGAGGHKEKAAKDVASKNTSSKSVGANSSGTTVSNKDAVSEAYHEGVKRDAYESGATEGALNTSGKKHNERDALIGAGAGAGAGALLSHEKRGTSDRNASADPHSAATSHSAPAATSSHPALSKQDESELYAAGVHRGAYEAGQVKATEDVSKLSEAEDEAARKHRSGAGIGAAVGAGLGGAGVLAAEKHHSGKDAGTSGVNQGSEDTSRGVSGDSTSSAPLNATTSAATGSAGQSSAGSHEQGLVVEVIGVLDRNAASKIAQKASRDLAAQGVDLSAGKLVINAGTKEVHLVENKESDHAGHSGAALGAGAGVGAGVGAASATHSGKKAASKDYPIPPRNDFEGSTNPNLYHDEHERAKKRLSDAAEAGTLGNIHPHDVHAQNAETHADHHYGRDAGVAGAGVAGAGVAGAGIGHEKASGSAPQDDSIPVTVLNSKDTAEATKIANSTVSRLQKQPHLLDTIEAIKVDAATGVVSDGQGHVIDLDRKEGSRDAQTTATSTSHTSSSHKTPDIGAGAFAGAGLGAAGASAYRSPEHQARDVDTSYDYTNSTRDLKDDVSGRNTAHGDSTPRSVTAPTIEIVGATVAEQDAIAKDVLEHVRKHPGDVPSDTKNIIFDATTGIAVDGTGREISTLSYGKLGNFGHSSVKEDVTMPGAFVW